MNLNGVLLSGKSVDLSDCPTDDCSNFEAISHKLFTREESLWVDIQCSFGIITEGKREEMSKVRRDVRTCIIK